jgi:hypothetical protein
VLGVVADVTSFGRPGAGMIALATCRGRNDARGRSTAALRACRLVNVRVVITLTVNTSTIVIVCVVIVTRQLFGMSMAVRITRRALSVGRGDQLGRRLDVVFLGPDQPLPSGEATATTQTFVSRHATARAVLAQERLALVLAAWRDGPHDRQTGVGDEESHQPGDDGQSAGISAHAVRRAEASHTDTLGGNLAGRGNSVVEFTGGVGACQTLTRHG